MALTIKARVVTAQSAVIVGLTIRAYAFTAAGSPILLGGAVTDGAGLVSIPSQWSPTADYQARVQLQAIQGRDPAVWLYAGPVSVVANVVDFGTVTYGQPAGALAGDPVWTADAVDAMRLDYQGQLTEKDLELAAVKQQLEAMQSAEPAPSTITEVARVTAASLEAAQQTLRSARSGFQLGNVSLSLKLMPSGAEGGVGLPSARHLEGIEAASLSTLDMAFYPTPAPAPAPVGEGTGVPSVMGYTEVLARRKLAERRLRAEVLIRVVESAEQEGRVVLQVPPAGASLADGGVVIIGIGRKG